MLRFDLRGIRDYHSGLIARHWKRIESDLMSAARENILQALRGIRLIDPHSHINPHAPASKTLADLLGYHYYTELAHSAGMPKVEIESRLNQPRELVGQLVKGLGHITNTAQYSWLIDICQRFFGLQGDSLDESNWEAVYDAAEAKMQMADWCDSVLDQSNVESVFLTNDFDDSLEGFDTNVYVPCLRTDDLVFHLSKQEVRDRLAVSSGIDLDGSLHSLRSALAQRFDRFVSRGARACAISLPPDFLPQRVSDGRASMALNAILSKGSDADDAHKAAMARRVFWTIVELCDEYHLPMDLMIGVNRGVYAEGVHQGRDLYDSRVSLIQYRELFNTFPEVKFPISVLASVTNQELVSYAWIFPNVITSGHWWYSNTPSFIRRDAQARLEAVPRNKQIGYYSDAYKLEFIAPKFDMYRRILAGILFEDFVVERGWSEEQAIELGRQVLRGNVESIFPYPEQRSIESTRDAQDNLGHDAASLYRTIVEPAAESLDAEHHAPMSQGTDLAAMGTAALAAGVVGFALAPDDQPVPEATGQPVDAPEIHYYRGDDEPLEQGHSDDADDLQLDFSDDDKLPEPQAEQSDLDWFADPNTGELTLPVPNEAEQGGELDEQYLLPDDEPSEEPNFDMYQTVYSPHVHEDVESPTPFQEPPVTDDDALVMDELELEPLDDNGVLDLDLMADEPELEELDLAEDDHPDFNPLATQEWIEPVSEDKEPD